MEAINLPADAVYDCLCCGKSCQGWAVPLDGPARERLQNHPLTIACRERGLEPLGEKSLGGTHKQGCYFLTAEKLCGLHDIKPDACRKFPYHACETPDGIFLSLSYRCRAVRQGYGRPLTEEPERYRRVLEQPMPKLGFGEILLNPKSSVDWETYRQYELQALESLESPQGLMAWAAHFLPPGWEPLSTCRALVAVLEGKDSEHSCAIEIALREGRPFQSRRGATMDASFQVRDEEFEAVIGRYLRQLLHRKFLLEGPHLSARALLLACLPAMLRFYLSQSLRASSEAVVADHHREEAFDRVEEELVTHTIHASRFLEFFYGLVFGGTDI